MVHSWIIPVGSCLLSVLFSKATKSISFKLKCLLFITFIALLYVSMIYAYSFLFGGFHLIIVIESMVGFILSTVHLLVELVISWQKKNLEQIKEKHNVVWGRN